MSTLSGSRVLLVVLLAPALFAQKPAVSSEATATAARARCTDLSGKIPKPCPTEGESPVRGAGSTSTGPNRCTNLAGKEVPCPASVETNSAAVVAGEPARLPMHCTNLAGKEVPCPSDAGTIVPAAVQTNPGAESTGCADLAGRELACPSSVTSGPVATTRHAPTGPSLERSLPVNLVQDQSITISQWLRQEREIRSKAA